MKETRYAFETIIENGKDGARNVEYLKVDGKSIARVRYCDYDPNNKGYRVFAITNNSMPEFVAQYKGITYKKLDDAKNALTSALADLYKRKPEPKKAKASKTDTPAKTVAEEPKAVAEPTDNDALLKAIATLAKSGDKDAVLALAKMLA